VLVPRDTAGASREVDLASGLAWKWVRQWG
jgi:transposase-like protein